MNAEEAGLMMSGWRRPSMIAEHFPEAIQIVDL
jgi:hypothetical protein